MYGLDLGVLWRERRVRKTLNLLARLPRQSHYKAALASDDEVVALMPESLGDYRPPLTEWSPEVEHLAVIADAVRALPAVISASAGVKNGPAVPKSLPRPDTAWERLKAKRARNTQVRTLSAIRAAQERTRRLVEGGDGG